MRATVFTALCVAIVALSTACQESPTGDPWVGPGPPPNHPLPFRTSGDYLSYFNSETGSYHPFFMKGINLGVGTPGHQPGQLAITRDQYYRWLERMGEMGVNTVRIYTLHFPRFYEEFAAYNARHPDRPLFLMQGIWLDEENPTHDFFDMTEHYDREIETVIDAVYGNAEVEFEYGKAFGTYTVDVSQWVVGWVTGREIYPDEVEHTNAVHADFTSYHGEALSITDTMPMECWLAERLDKVITYERGRYGSQRPVSYSSWPTLDPLVHPIEGWGSDEDRVNISLEDLDLHDAPGGFFIIYHAYPYYPDFIVETPDYYEFWDDFGRNSYLGYLTELKEHYVNTPVIVGEFGTPSSWGNAHYGQNGMHHGGHDEATVGHFAVRLLDNIFQSGCGGGIYFAWMDEWWKRTWITDEIDFPRNRRFRWHNVTAAEQNFGLVAFSLGEPEFSQYTPIPGVERINEVEVDVDAEFFHLRVWLGERFEVDDELVIGFDTYREDLGESILPNGVATELRAEIALALRGDGEALLYVTEAYDTYGIWHGTSEDHQLFHSIPTDGADWVLIRWKNNLLHVSSDGEHHYPETSIAMGILRSRRADEPASNLDAVVLGTDVIEIRVPWTLLNFNDPSQLSVLDDDRQTPGRETATSDGVALTISWGDEVLVSGRHTWEPWHEAPPTVEREKPSLELYSQGVQAMPGDLPVDRFSELPADLLDWGP